MHNKKEVKCGGKGTEPQLRNTTRHLQGTDRLCLGGGFSSPPGAKVATRTVSITFCDHYRHNHC